MFRRKGRHSPGAHVPHATASDLGAVTTLSSVAVGVTARGGRGGVDPPAVATTDATTPAPVPRVLSTVPEAALVAVRNSSLALAPPGAPDMATVWPSVEVPSPPDVVPVVSPPPAGVPPAPASPVDTSPTPTIPPLESTADATAADSTAGSGTVIVPVSGAGRRARRMWPRLATLLLAVVVAALVLAGLQLARPYPKPLVRSATSTAAPVPGAAPALPFPVVGESAVALPALGLQIESGPEPRVPIASLTKMMTAYLTLRDHPLAPNAQGPLLTFSAADSTEADVDEDNGATAVPVQAGERLSERQVLDGLMVHSANNFADVLATWDSGTVPAFVAKMNLTAAALGMHDTHYADANGLSPASVGSAGDELRIAAAAMANPTFAAIVAQPSVTLPLAGLLPNYVSAVGHYGIVGIKSGFTQAAMGCLVMAGVRSVEGKPVIVLAAVTGQPGLDPLATANAADLSLINAVGDGLRVVPVVTKGTRVASVSVPWSGASVPAVATADASLVAWPGEELQLRVSTNSPRAGAAAGTRVGTFTASIGPERVAVAVDSTGSLGAPSLSWRLRQH